jgi:epoxyqueuosine reductase
MAKLPFQLQPSCHANPRELAVESTCVTLTRCTAERAKSPLRLGSAGLSCVPAEMTGAGMKLNNQIENPKAWIEALIKSFTNGCSENSLKNRENDRAWADPLIGFSSGDDPIYQEFKRYIGPFHWTPSEIFNQSFPELKVRQDQLTIISWVLPHTDDIKSDNRKETIYPSEKWVRARVYGEEFNKDLHRHVVSTLQASGFEAVAPTLSTLWGTKMSKHYGLASTWSERHGAYASGLGTFGLCDGLITPRGKAVRIGSVVARIKIPPSKRGYKDHHAYCLFFTKGQCGECIHRCPAGAITEAGHDKVKCRDYIQQVIVNYVKTHFGFEGYGCGLCQTGVPCESEIPSKPL